MARHLQTLTLLSIITILIPALAALAQTPTRQPQRESENAVLPAPDSVKRDLYPAGVDTKKEIAAALKNSARDHKRVLLVFGGNWCYDCHVLDRALHEGTIGKIVNQRFLLVHVDIAEGDKNLDLVKLY